MRLSSGARRDFMRRVALITGILVALAIATFGLLHAPFVRTWALTEVTTRLQRAGFAFRASRLDYNLATLTVHLYDVNLAIAATPSRPFFSAAEIHATLGWGALSGRIDFTRVEAVAPRVVLARGQDGRGNWPSSTGSSAPSSSSTPVHVRRALVRDLRFTWEDEHARTSLEIGVSADLTSEGNVLSGPITMTSRTGFEWRDHGTTVQKLDGRLSWNERDLSIDGLTIDAPEGSIRVDGRIIDLTGAPRVDARVGGDVNLQAVARWMNGNAVTGGVVRADARVEGPLKAPETTLTLSGDLLAQRLPSMAVEAAARIGVGGAEIQRLRAELAGGSVSTVGHISPNGTGELRIEWDRLDAASIFLALDPTAAVVPAARVRGSLEARWSSAELDSVRANADVRSTSVPRNRLTFPASTKRRPRTIPIDAVAKLNLRGALWSLDTTADLLYHTHATAKVSGRLNEARMMASSIGGSLRLEVQDLGQLSQELVRSGFVAESVPLAGESAGDFTVGGTFESPSLEGGLDAALRYAELPAASLQTRLSASAREWSLRDLDARMSGSRAQGSLGWRPRSDAISGHLDVSLPVTDLVHVPGILPATEPVDGSLTLAATISGSRAHPQAAVVAEGAGISIAGQLIDRVTAAARVDPTTVAVDQLTVTSGEGRIRASGTADLTRETYSAHGTIENVPIRPVPGVAGRSEMPIAATLNGTFDGESTSGDLSGRGRLAFSSARWGSADLGQLETDVTLAGREVAFGLTARDLTLDATGSVVIDPGGALSLRAAWDPRDLAALAQRLDVKLPESSGGSAAMRVELSGVRDDTSSLRGRADISALDVSVAGQPIQLSRPGYIQYDGRTVQADNLEFAAGMSKMRLSGSLGDSSEAGLVLNLDGLLADLAFTRELWQSLFEGRTQLPPPSGSISLRVAATGSLEHPNLSASLRIASAEVPVTTRQNVTGIEIDAQYSDGLLAVNTGAAAFEGATLALTGRLPSDLFREKLPPRLQPFIVSSGGRARLSAKLLGITPSVAAPFVEPGALEDITGRIDASIDFEADDLNVERIHGSIVLDHAEIAVGGATFAQRVSTRVDVAGGRATVAAWEWGQGDDRITLAGGATLGEDPKLDLTATGALDLALMNLVLPGARVAGRADVNVRATGAASMPSVDGRVKVHEGETRIPNPRFVISGIEGTIAFAGDTLSLEKMTATVNGGDVVLAGTMHHRWFTGFEGKITLRGTGVPLDIAGVRGEADADLALTIDPRGPVLGGTVTLARSSYRESLAFAGGLFRREQRRVTGNGLDRGSPVARTRLDVHLVTKEDLLVDIQEAQLSIRFDLRVGGTVERPSLTGRATLGEGGLIYVGANRYHLVDQGSVDFSNPNRIEPELNLSAVTRVQGTEIRLGLEGTPAELQTTLTSDDPSLSRSDLVSLLVTGKTAAEAAEDGVMPGGDLLIGVLSSQLLGAAGRVVGLDTVRVERGEPDVRFDAGLVATETDPGARLTVGTNIGTDWEVVLSQSLEDSGGLTWIVSYAAWRALNVRVVSLDDGERLYGFQRDVSFGRVEETGKPVRVLAPTVSQVTIAGAGPDEAALRSLLKVGPGARFDLFRWQDDRERVERYYYERQQFEARVVTRRTLNPSAQTISLAYEIVPGSRGSIVVDGYTLSGSALRRIETAWTHAVVDGFLTEEAAAIARTELAREGFVRASVDAVVERREEEKQLHLRVTPGARAGRRTIEFSGNEQMTSERLRKALSDAGLDQEIWLDAVRVRETLQEVYREAGYREADIRVDDVDIVDDTATRPVRINEGRQFRLRGIPRVNGAHGLPVEAITEVAALSAGDVFTEARIDKARDDVDTAYRAKGFNAASVTIDAVEAPDSAEVDVTIEVDEGPQQRLGDIQTTGLHRVRPGIVDRALNLKVGEPIDLAAWNNARKRLYETGAFRSVDIEREVIRTADAPSGVRDGVMEQEVRAKVSVQEWPFMRLRYGVDVEDEPAPTTGSAAVSAESSDGRTFGLGVAADLGVRHLFGRTLSAGVAGRYSGDFSAVRLYTTTPVTFGRPITSNIYFERSREEVGTTEDGGPETLSYESTLTFEQRIRPTRKIEISYRYSLEEDTDVDPVTRVEAQSQFTGMLASTALLDGRNDLVNPTGGWFHSSTIEYAPDAFGSTVPFTKYLLQQRLFRSAGPVVFGAAASVGLATAYGQQLDEDDRFFAGGGNSVRGYSEDSLSPLDPSGGTDDPDDEHGAFAGGNALLIFNTEVRFPMFKISSGVGSFDFRGVSFFDAGRAFDNVRDLSLSKLSTSVGLGLRVHTPFMLLRLDVGYPLDNDVDASGPQWFFSIGQMF